MDWKRLAIAPRRKAVSTALIYGLSLTVRFTSPTAEEATPQAAQNANASTSILIDRSWPNKPTLPIALRGWPLGPRSCRAGCEGPALLSSLPNCIAP
ncbi:hypothetical protein [Bradyrhizobium liaoningense]|uniref:hypothetical protein n=1 Tax=Bradyrhizobium liaoningense TaxID=43992 RepID=UPI001BADC226|nr:hypothetical protein [Bradyrhizobium liaoningense]MBR0822530.1 hypothetical protein [Bradyrhizobium liaoningense]